MIVHVCPGPDTLLREGEPEVRWCFGCRAHLVHAWQLWGDSEPSYYEPIWICRCSRCGRDRTTFPGRGW